MIVKYRKAFFNDVGKIKNLKLIEEIEFNTVGSKPLYDCRRNTGLQITKAIPW